MHSAKPNAGTESNLNIADVSPRLDTTKQPAGTPHIRAFCERVRACVIRGAVTVAVLSGLLLIAARPAQAQTETELYGFGGAPDGGDPQSSLTFHGGDYVYGTTQYGGLGSGNGQLGWGTVFELETSPQHTETVIYRFCSAPNCADGGSPAYSSVIFDQLGNLYGTASGGGAYGNGVVFELSPAGAGWTETVLYSFCAQSGCADGSYPVNSLIFDPAGNLYGTTQRGGSGQGTVFELSPSGSGWTEQVIYAPGSSAAGLTMDAAGNIYTYTNQNKLVQLSPNGSDGWSPTVMHAFGGFEGEKLGGTPALDADGNVYITVTSESGYGSGALYKFSRKDGAWTKQALESWKTGLAPWAGVVLDGAGNIYGTTGGGGTDGYGTVFELAVKPKGGYEKRVLWNFLLWDGSWPYATLTLDSQGNLYGTTYVGGGAAGCAFELTP